MKTTKIFLLTLLAFASVECFSQNYGEEYLERLCLPSSFSTCRTLTESEGGIWKTNANIIIRPVLNAGDTITDIEQFYPCDSTVRLAGIACLGGNSDTLMSLRLRDVLSDTIITSVYRPFFNQVIVHSSDDAEIHILEYSFDNVITVNRDFSLSLWFPEEFYEEGANIYSHSWMVTALDFAYFNRNPQTGEVTSCHSNKTPMVRYTDGTTKPFLQMLQEIGQVMYAEELHIERGWYCDIFYFPIFAEPGEEGEGEGGNSAVVDVNLESYTSLYPNPANESVNVVCSYKIKDYVLVDATGREVLSGKCNANSIALDVSSLQKGVYFIRIQTAKGEVKKKLLVE